jgi:hypothetical protein
MCGRIIQAGFGGMKILMGTPDDSRIKKPRYNGAPSQDLVVIRRQRLLRVEGHQGRQGQATLCHCHEGRQPVLPRRHLGELEEP